MTQTRADELKHQIAGLDSLIAEEVEEVENRLKRIASIRVYIDHLRTRRAKLEAQLAREDALHVKPEGPHAKLLDANGVEWKV